MRYLTILTLLNVDADCCAQSKWNALEESLINATDIVALLCSFVKNVNTKKSLVPNVIKNCCNKRKRLLMLTKRCTPFNYIKLLNKRIAKFFIDKKVSAVRHVAEGLGGNLWKAVRVANNQNVDDIPKNLTLGGVKVDE